MKTYAILLMLVATALLVGCHTATRPASYGGELADCTATSKTCDESIKCENTVRAKYGRALRDVAAGCQ